MTQEGNQSGRERLLSEEIQTVLRRRIALFYGTVGNCLEENDWPDYQFLRFKPYPVEATRLLFTDDCDIVVDKSGLS